MSRLIAGYNSQTPDRRQILSGGSAVIGMGLAASMAPARAWATAQSRRRIDVHHHMSPPFYADYILRTRGRLPIKWSLDMTMDEMDKNDVSSAILSLIIPGVWFGKPDPELRMLARQCNEYGAKLAQDYPGRFGFFAAIPLPDTEGSLNEIAYSLDVLKADGIALWTSYSGKYLGDTAFAPVFEELNRRKAIVYTHPTPPDCCIGLIKDVPESTIEYTNDTARTIASLVFAEAKTLMHCPDIKFIWPHSGGAFPSLRYRMEELANQRKEQFPDGILPLFHNFYYDVADTTRAQHAALAETTDYAHIMFGSDFPYARSADVIRHLAESKLSEAHMRAIERGNAMQLFPRFRA